MPIRLTKRTPFGQRSRRAQKRSFIRVRDRIQRSATVLGGKFTTRYLMHDQTEWLDLVFLGTQAHVPYGVALQTTKCEYRELVRERAWELSYELAPKRQHNEREHILTASTSTDPTTVVSQESWQPVRYPELGNLTRLEWAQTQHQQIADSGEIQVFERWTLHPEYHNSIGLHATIDVPFLSIDTVNAFIDRFLMTETNFKDSTPRIYRYDQFQGWGLTTNMLLEPEQWEEAIAASPIEAS